MSNISSRSTVTAYNWHGISTTNMCACTANNEEDMAVCIIFTYANCRTLSKLHSSNAHYMPWITRFSVALHMPPFLNILSGPYAISNFHFSRSSYSVWLTSHFYDLSMANFTCGYLHFSWPIFFACGYLQIFQADFLNYDNWNWSLSI